MENLNIEIIGMMAIWIVTLLVVNRYHNKTNKMLLAELKELSDSYNKLLQERLKDEMKSKNPVIKSLEDLFAKIGASGEVQVIEFKIPNGPHTSMDEFKQVYETLTYDEFIDVLDNQDPDGLEHLRDLLVKNKIKEKVNIMDGYLKNKFK